MDCVRNDLDAERQHSAESAEVIRQRYEARLGDLKAQWDRETGVRVAEAKLQARQDCEPRLSRNGTRNPNQRDSNAKLGIPANGAGAGTVDSVQSPYTPTSQVVGSPLVLSELIGNASRDGQQGAPGRIPDKRGKAPIDPTQYPRYGVQEGSYQTYQRLEENRHQHHHHTPLRRHLWV